MSKQMIKAKMFKSALELLLSQTRDIIVALDYENVPTHAGDEPEPPPFSDAIDVFDHAFQNAADARNEYLAAADEDVQDIIITWEDREADEE